jgi:hypothetical protein
MIILLAGALRKFAYFAKIAKYISVYDNIILANQRRQEYEAPGIWILKTLILRVDELYSKVTGSIFAKFMVAMDSRLKSGLWRYGFALQNSGIFRELGAMIAFMEIARPWFRDMKHTLSFHQNY